MSAYTGSATGYEKPRALGSSIELPRLPWLLARKMAVKSGFSYNLCHGPGVPFLIRVILKEKDLVELLKLTPSGRGSAVRELSSSKTQLSFLYSKGEKKSDDKVNCKGKGGNKLGNIIDNPSLLANNQLVLHLYTTDASRWVPRGSQAVGIFLDQISVQSEK